jgi:hypothetical protein
MLKVNAASVETLAVARKIFWSRMGGMKLGMGATGNKECSAQINALGAVLGSNLGYSSTPLLQL